MPRLLQQLLSVPFETSAVDPRAGVPASGADDDIALGFECATPALQFDSWDPAPLLPPSQAPAY